MTAAAARSPSCLTNGPRLAGAPLRPMKPVEIRDARWVDLGGVSDFAGWGQGRRTRIGGWRDWVGCSGRSATGHGPARRLHRRPMVHGPARHLRRPVRWPRRFDRPASPVPLVLDVHGGPWARDSYGFNGEHQWLANRGLRRVVGQLSRLDRLRQEVHQRRRPRVGRATCTTTCWMRSTGR